MFTEEKRRQVVTRNSNIEVVQEENGLYTGYVLSKDDAYPAAPDMQTKEAAYQGAKEWDEWMMRK